MTKDKVSSQGHITERALQQRSIERAGESTWPRVLGSVLAVLAFGLLIALVRLIQG